jgi:phospholipase D1/2
MLRKPLATDLEDVRRTLVLQILIGFAIVGGIALVWRFTPLAQMVRPQHVAAWLESFESQRWAPAVFIAAFVIGGLVVFPVTLMSAATAIVFPPLKAMSITFTGIMLSAALLHWLGARLLKKRLQKKLGRTIGQVKEHLSDEGILTIAALRMVPLAPFTLVNLAAGSLGVRFRDFMFGTALGLAPGMTLVCIFGRQVRQFWRDPSGTAVLLVIGVFVVWMAISLSLQRLVAHRHRARPA